MIDRGNFSGFGPPGQAAEVFVSCSESSDDKALRAELETHLAPLVTQGLVRVWHRDKTGAGEARTRTAAERLDSAHVVLLLVSATYLASDECRLEVERAMARSGALIVPLLLSPAAWEDTAFGDLAPLPSRVPVIKWPLRADAWNEAVRKLRTLIERYDHRSSRPPPPSSGAASSKPMYVDRMTRVLSEDLEDAYRRQERLKAIGQDSDAITHEILNLKRQLRAAGHLRAGDVLGNDGRYLLMNQLGRGGFALIWRAHDRVRGEDVAIKVLRPDLAADPGRLDRFRRGARVMKQLRHPSIVRVLDIPPPDIGWYYYVMELLRGGDLREAVLARRVSQEQVFSIMLSVSSAIAEVHAANWVHRDVKPANIVLSEANAPKITDFDLVGGPETTGGTTRPIGTPIFAPPELITRPQNTDKRVDVYSLGMTTLFALHGENWPDDILFREHARTLISRLHCSDAVKEVLGRAVDLDANGRFIDAAAFRDALARAVNRPSMVPEPPPDSFREVTAQHRVLSLQAARSEVTPTPPPPATPQPADPFPEYLGPQRVPDNGSPRNDRPPVYDITAARTERIHIESPPVGDTPLLQITDAFLVLKSAPSGVPVNTKFLLQKSPISVGRESLGDGGGIVLPHNSISRAHARIELRGFSLVVVDEGSTNGTFVGTRLTWSERDRVFGVALLHYGDLISFGREYVFQLELKAYVGGESHLREFERLKVDDRTGLPSRRYLLWCLEREALAAQQQRQSLSFLVLQLLRRAGDPGPPVDELLAELARIVGQQEDMDGLVGRFGGRSIGVLLKGKTAETASALAAEVRWQAPPSMSIRFGAAEILSGDRDPAEALRNRVLAALDVPPGEDGENS